MPLQGLVSAISRGLVNVFERSGQACVGGRDIVHESYFSPLAISFDSSREGKSAKRTGAKPDLCLRGRWVQDRDRPFGRTGFLSGPGRQRLRRRTLLWLAILGAAALLGGVLPGIAQALDTSSLPTVSTTTSVDTSGSTTASVDTSTSSGTSSSTSGSVDTSTSTSGSTNTSTSTGGSVDTSTSTSGSVDTSTSTSGSSNTSTSTSGSTTGGS